MGVEAPLALLGLLAAGIPFLVHRLRRTDPVLRVLPTFALLQQAEASRRRARTLTDRMLLALRVALLALAAVALSAPFVTARVPFGDGTVAATAVVIDDSASMQRGRAGATLLHDAVERAEDALASFPPGSEVAIVLAGRPARVLVARTDDLDVAEQALETVMSSEGRGTDLGDAVRLAMRELRSASLAERRLLVLSDFAPHAALEPGALSAEGIDLVIEALGDPAPASNTHIAAVRVERGDSADTLTMHVEVRTAGQGPARIPVEVVQEDRALARVDVEMTEGVGRASLKLPRPRKGGDTGAEVRIAVEDALRVDNRVAALLAPPRALRVLAVNGDPQPASSDDELHYLLQALELVPEEEGAVSLRHVDADALARHDLAGTDVLLLANVPAPPAALAARIAAFVRQGGGLVIAPGDRVVPRAYANSLGSLLPCSITTIARAREAGFAPAEPSALLPHGSVGLARVVARTHLVLDAGPEADVLLRFADGEPALVSGEVGQGRVSVLATTIDDGWSDLPLRPGFLPLVWSLVRDAARIGGAAAGPFAPGETVPLAVPPGTLRMEVVAPTGERHVFDGLDGKVSIRFDEARRPGAYRVLAAGRSRTLREVPRGGFVVRTPPEESVLSPQTLPDVAAASTTGGTSGAVVNRPLSPWFFLACALFALGEGWLRSRRRR